MVSSWFPLLSPVLHSCTDIESYHQIPVVQITVVVGIRVLTILFTKLAPFCKSRGGDVGFVVFTEPNTVPRFRDLGLQMQKAQSNMDAFRCATSALFRRIWSVIEVFAYKLVKRSGGFAFFPLFPPAFNYAIASLVLQRKTEFSVVYLGSLSPTVRSFAPCGHHICPPFLSCLFLSCLSRRLIFSARDLSRLFEVIVMNPLLFYIYF